MPELLAAWMFEICTSIRGPRTCEQASRIAYE
jgi:hypothetical protein